MKNYLQYFGGLVFALLLAMPLTGMAQIEIRNWNDLNNVRNNLSGSYILMNDLTAETAGYATYAAGEGWMPIGTGADPFIGTFDGQNYRIENLRINRPTPDVGFFGVTTNATIRNLHLVNADVTAVGSNSGVLAGRTFGGLVQNVHVSGSFRQVENGDNTNFGGLIARMHGGLVTVSSSAVNVNTLGRFVGGLAGSMTGFGGNPAVIENSFNTGNITSAFRWVGGITGQFGGSSMIRNTYNTGNITGTTQVGGLTGFHWRGSEVHNSYSIGTVTGTEEFGALVGHMDPQQGDVIGRVESSFFDTQVTGTSTGIGIGTANGAFGRTTDQMKSQATYTGWDFDTIWSINPDFNNGYPVLKFQTATSLEGLEEIPVQIMLSQNYPNPFNPSTVIQFELPEAMHVNLSVYTINGQLVATLTNEVRSAGVHEIPFQAGSSLSSGIYIYTLRAGNVSQTRRMTLIK